MFKKLAISCAVLAFALFLVAVMVMSSLDDALSPPTLSSADRETFETLKGPLLAELPPDSHVEVAPEHHAAPTISVKVQLGDSSPEDTATAIKEVKATIEKHAPRGWKSAVDTKVTIAGRGFWVLGSNTHHMAEHLSFLRDLPDHGAAHTNLISYDDTVSAEVSLARDIRCEDYLDRLAEIASSPPVLTVHVLLGRCKTTEQLFDLYFRPGSVNQQAKDFAEFISIGPKDKKYEATSLPDGTLVINEDRYRGQARPAPADPYAAKWPNGKVRMRFNDLSITRDGQINDY